MKMIEIVEARPTDAGRRKRIDEWIDALFTAETVARAEAAADLKLKPRHFLINYRIASESSATMGTGAERRGALVEIIESLEPVEKHLSTSTWLVRLHIQEASDIRNLLVGPLDAKLDGLHVTHASKTNRAAFGTSELRS